MGNNSSKNKDAPKKDTCGAWIAKEKNQELVWVEDWKLPTWGPDQIELEVTHNGLCHTDIHMRDNDHDVSSFPLCAGHEVIGVVKHVGKDVTKIKVGDRVGVGWIKGSCGECIKCQNDCQNVCFNNYNGLIVGNGYFKSEEPSGGFAERCRVNENFAYRIPKSIESEHAAPLMCAGATVWAPLRKYVLESCHGAKNMKIGVAGIGGLGHMALKIAVPMECEIYALSSSDRKRDLVKACGEKINYVNMSVEKERDNARGLDFILNTIPFDNAHEKYIELLRHDGTYCAVGIPKQNITVSVPVIVFLQYHIVGSIVAGRDDMISMLDWCEKYKIAPEVVMKKMSEINECMDEVENNKVPHRFVLTFDKTTMAGKVQSETLKTEDEETVEDQGGDAVPTN